MLVGQSDNLAVRLSRYLSVPDLSLSYARFERRVQAVLAKETYVHALCPIKGMPRSWIGVLADGHGQHSYFISRAGTKVRCDQFPEMGEEEWFPTEFRLVGAKLVGSAEVGGGNTRYAAVAVYRPKGGRWIESYSYVEENESYVTFVNSKRLDASCRIRDYDFNAFGQPHAGPLLTRISRWKYVNGAYRIGSSHLVHNALWAFDDLMAAWQNQDWKAVIRRCPDAHIRAEIRRAVSLLSVNRAWHAICPKSVEYDDGHVFGLWPGDETTKFPFFEMGLVKGRWQVVRTASEDYFVRRDGIRG